ncbi:MAG TPA: serine/threonine-protein kinase [Gemmatimonadaceae bacterium]|nr:serine/threonine-protein kinase [Gemmatimonadaceae bacterium]
MTAPATLSLDSIRRSLGDRYLLERELGRGGMGTVYLAREIKLDRPVALKVLLPELVSQSGLRDRFLRETRTAASFSHPNIVPVYAVEESDDHLAYAMGLVEGETLSERVARSGPLPVRELVRMVKDVAHALAYAHGRGVVHRDIKPDNVMLERATGRALVLDFGISRSMVHAAPSATNLTRVGEVVGTPEYMSPEQASGDVVDGRSDIYSLGLTAYYAATGQVAVTGENTQKILARQLTEPLTPIESLRADLPGALAAAIDRCVEKDPADRFPSAESLVEAIDAAQLVEREIPLPVRLFAGELSTLLLAIAIIVVVMWSIVEAQLHANMSALDTMLPVVGLLAILVTRTLTTMSEGRRLAMAGFSAHDVIDGMGRVMHERVTRRDELRADPETRRRRTFTIYWGIALLVASVTMIRLALAMRVRISEHQYASPPGGIALVFTGFALLGASLVLLLKSPFRMPPGERIFRLLWLGPIGRTFVRLSMRGARPSAASARRPRATPVVSVVRAPAAPSLATPRDPLTSLEARVAELERWRDGLQR